MFQTFTGTSRRPRQVNLSGRNNNPFAAVQQSPHTRGPPSAVAQAQQERKARQHEREKLQAAQAIQRTWRGHSSREAVKRKRRRAWDERCQRLGLDASSGVWQEHIDPEEVVALLKQLLLFASPRDSGDWGRVAAFSRLFVQTDHLPRSPRHNKAWTDWTKAIQRLFEVALAMASQCAACLDHSPLTLLILDYLQLLLVIVTQDTLAITSYHEYYSTLAELILVDAVSQEDVLKNTIVQLVCTPLSADSGLSDAAYRSFSADFLTTPHLSDRIDLGLMASAVDLQRLQAALRHLLEPDTKPSFLERLSNERKECFLAYVIIVFRRNMEWDRRATLDDSVSRSSPGTAVDFMRIVNNLLSDADQAYRADIDRISRSSDPKVRNSLLGEINLLVDRAFMTSILEISYDFFGYKMGSKQDHDIAAVMSNYVLLLLQLFPNRKNDIRTWLYTKWFVFHDSQGNTHSTSMIKFLWEFFSSTSAFRRILNNPKNAVEMMQADRNLQEPRLNEPWNQAQAWRVGLLFLELYAFALRVMDDDEFMYNFETAVHDSQPSVYKEHALQKGQVWDLGKFLKNLAFAIYWFSSDIRAQPESRENPTSLAQIFGNSGPSVKPSPVDPLKHKSDDAFVGGLEWASMSYVKGLVTELLRALYERDSRRPFFPKGHWLMPEFDIDGLIPHVVAEQQYRIEQGEDVESDDEDPLDADEDTNDMNLVGTAHIQQQIRAEQARRRRQRAARKKTLESVTPRLEILQSMPFFIPFATRVEIFREFVTMDQKRRRGGVTDPDQWRMIMADAHFRSTSGQVGSPSQYDLSKHAAKVRREHVFEDAYEQFYQLGEGLKEPIQITFVDQFDSPEPGIDGGGVTKEFLTSITKEAFSVANPSKDLFVETENHLLYPNPGIFDSLKDDLRARRVAEGSLEWKNAIRDLVNQYEFLGRVVGKCLYEGILVDIHFAPFFLVKWGKTGGSGFGANESNYHASINDLRDLDEGLYQGLLRLKNYNGNVERDLGLDFTIIDTHQAMDKRGHLRTKQVTRELRGCGANTPVTNENRVVYLYAVAHHRLVAQPAVQTRAFLRGLGCMVQSSWLTMFNQGELQTLVGGDAAEIDVADLRAHTQYSGAYALGDDGQEHPTVRMFWRVMKELSDEQRRAVLRYVTSTPRGPLLGFQMLNPRFSIRDSGSDQSRLPSTSTCVNLLKLPIYTSQAVLKEKLMYAVNSGAGFDLS